MSFNKSPIASFVVLSALAGLTACGGGSSDSPDTGTFSMAVTDAPIDMASEVVVEFTGVVIKPANGDEIGFIFDTPKSINLLELQGTASEALVSGEVVAAGEYEWMRLDINAEEGVSDSYIVLTDGTQLELRIPSGAQTGLKLVSGFTVPVGGSADFTVDFDLRKSISLPVGMSGTANLRPTLRVVDNTVVGSIGGTIDSSLVSEQCADASVDDGAVYIYSGADVTPADVAGTETDPLISALVNFEDGSYSYEAGFLSEGSYTVAYTCEAGLDDPEAADAISFVGTTNVDVTADTQSTVDFAVAAEAVAQ